MKKEALETIKQKLLKEKKELENELLIFTKKDPHTKDNYMSRFPDFGNKTDENAAEVATFGNRLSLEDTLEKAIRDINATLKRIKGGTYGVCKYCKKPINEKRLIARPTSSSCIDCKKELTGSK